LGRALLRLFRRGVEGRIVFDGEDLLAAPRERLRQLRRKLGVVFQDPYASLDPRMRIAEIVSEPLRIHESLDAANRRQRAADALAEVGLPVDALDRYPHQFSGGQRQRIAIARALICRPDLLVCDEAVSALDAQHRAEILALLSRLKHERGLAMLFITHDFNAARALADRIAVMDGGRLVEQGDADQVLSRPGHPATQAMLAAWAAPIPAAIT
jgi:ABC-type microcin C transport system duplicated ATPase subunit YejF